jgi:hypothetical protein
MYIFYFLFKRIEKKKISGKGDQDLALNQGMIRRLFILSYQSIILLFQMIKVQAQKYEIVKV